VYKAVRWRPELELGIDMMDRHHREMVGLCGALVDKAGSRAGLAAAGNLFLQLLDLTKMHFEAEEDLMRRSDYPGRTDHQDRHHELSLLLKSWEKRARSLNTSFVQHLDQWVENHILGSDKGFSRYLLDREGHDPTEPIPRRRGAYSVRQTPVPFKPISCDRLAQPQPFRRRFDRPLRRFEHVQDMTAFHGGQRFRRMSGKGAPCAL
jgi:hemerythrin